MHISELRLSGFKSFVDPVRAPIEAGITGVVGPNGCGKSNLLEAVRWAMGATSAKSMRADEMDAVIFAGSSARPAREHAEVTLIVKDALGRAPGEHAKEETLEITRRIRRGLGSTFRINGKEVRAKDVQLLFADASTGANSPALVRQGQVSELIAAKPENRRRILEEAAGVAGLHARRHEADLKLKQAESNLSRLDEILGEIEAQIASLKKQARQAERYRGLAAAIRETEALILHRRWSEARTALAEMEEGLRAAQRDVAEAATRASEAAGAAEEARQALAPLREEEAVATALLRRMEGVRVGHERDLQQAEEKLARAEADRMRIEEEAERLEAFAKDAERAMARLKAELDGIATDADDALKDLEAKAAALEAARAEAEKKLEGLAAEAAARAARARALAETAGAARARLNRLNDRCAQLKAALAAAAAPGDLTLRIGEAQSKAEAAQKESSAAREALAKAEGALQKAQAADEAAWGPARAAEAALAQIAAEVRALEQLAPAPSGKAFPPVLGEINVEPGYERALAAALGDDLDASRRAEAPLRWSGADAPSIDWPKGVRPLTDFVSAPAELAARLAMIGVSQDGASLQKSLPPGARLVSLQGDLWRWDGFVRTSAAPAPAAARLEQRNRLRKAREELKTATERAEGAKRAAQEAQAARRKAEDDARALRQKAPALAQKAAEAARALEKLQAEGALIEERAATLTAQLEQAEAERTEADAAAASAGAAAAETPQENDAALAEARGEVENARRAAAGARAAATGLARERQARAARRQALGADIAQWTERLTSAQARREALHQERELVLAALEAARAAPAKAREALEELIEKQTLAEERRMKAAEAVAVGELTAREGETLARDRETAHAAAREKRAGAEARTAGARERIADIEAQAREITGQPAEELAGLAGKAAASALGAGPIGEIERKLERLKTERDSAGPVNLRAEEEMAEAETRRDDLKREQEDVQAGVTKLRRAIGQINSDGRARLLAAFEIVNKNFSNLFTTLFEGGAAELRLTESDDPLAAGLEIMAQPPGKRLTTLSLMSGGEQALTAASLIFAVFLANPAPLCVLDEVDAPLDDANVERFCRLLDEMKRLTSTRFLVITHNPVTMSRVDRLYGVTMPEKGLSQLVSVDLMRARQLAATA